MTKNLFILGAPESGKTRVVRDVALAKKTRVGGFYIEPLMGGRIRKGLIIRTFDGQDRMLASKTVKSAHQMGKFPVDMNALENVGVPALRLALMTKDLVVIDDIGTLEAMSTRFRETLFECLNSSKPVLATLRPTHGRFTEEIKHLPDSQTLVLTKSNATSVKLQVRKWMDAHL